MRRFNPFLCILLLLCISCGLSKKNNEDMKVKNILNGSNVDIKLSAPWRSYESEVLPEYIMPLIGNLDYHGINSELTAEEPIILSIRSSNGSCEILLGREGWQHRSHAKRGLARMYLDKDLARQYINHILVSYVDEYEPNATEAKIIGVDELGGERGQF